MGQIPAADAKTFVTDDFRLQSGVVMPDVTIAYRTLGRLAPDRNNVVLVTHGNTSGPQMIDPGGSTGEGSWSELVGPDKAVDTNSFFVICPNMLGSSYGSTNAASVDPATYFLLDSEYGHSASGRDAHKWAPRLRQFIERLNQLS